jgi:hypothetical protein
MTDTAPTPSPTDDTPVARFVARLRGEQWYSYNPVGNSNIVWIWDGCEMWFTQLRTPFVSRTLSGVTLAIFTDSVRFMRVGP